jgi:hypothetical protein
MLAFAAPLRQLVILSPCPFSKAHARTGISSEAHQGNAPKSFTKNTLRRFHPLAGVRRPGKIGHSHHAKSAARTRRIGRSSRSVDRHRSVTDGMSPEAAPARGQPGGEPFDRRGEPFLPKALSAGGPPSPPACAANHAGPRR